MKNLIFILFILFTCISCNDTTAKELPNLQLVNKAKGESTYLRISDYGIARVSRITFDDGLEYVVVRDRGIMCNWDKQNIKLLKV